MSATVMDDVAPPTTSRSRPRAVTAKKAATQRPDAAPAAPASAPGPPQQGSRTGGGRSFLPKSPLTSPTPSPAPAMERPKAETPSTQPLAWPEAFKDLVRRANLGDQASLQRLRL